MKAAKVIFQTRAPVPWLFLWVDRNNKLINQYHSSQGFTLQTHIQGACTTSMPVAPRGVEEKLGPTPKWHCNSSRLPHGPWCFHVFSHSGSMSIYRSTAGGHYIYIERESWEYTHQIWFHFIFLSNAWLVHRPSIWNDWPELFIWSLNCPYSPTLNIRKTTWESKKIIWWFSMVSCRISPEAAGKSMLPNSNVCLYTAQAISGVASVFLVCFRLRICQNTCGQHAVNLTESGPANFPLVTVN